MRVSREGVAEVQASRENFKAWPIVNFSDAAERTESLKSVDQM